MSIMGAAGYATKGFDLPVVVFATVFLAWLHFCWSRALVWVSLLLCGFAAFPKHALFILTICPYGSVHVRPRHLQYGYVWFFFFFYSNRSELWDPPLCSLGGEIIKQPWGKLILTIGLCGPGHFPRDEEPKAGFDNEESSLCSLIIYATSASQHLCQRVAIITALG